VFGCWKVVPAHITNRRLFGIVLEEVTGS
jgi:hypothetical protein